MAYGGAGGKPLSACWLTEKRYIMKKHLPTIILIGIFIIGLSVFLYPTVSEYVNSKTQSRAINEYSEQVTKLSETDYRKTLQAAKDYNKRLLEKTYRFEFNEEERIDYNNQLNITDTGVIGFLEIPVIQVRLPIYRGTDETVLQIGVGHLEGSSLPVGGLSTHTVVSGHRALPSATLLSNLDQMSKGDLFIFQIMDETLTYQVDQILIVEPDDFGPLKIEKEKDLATLITCTPYGVNTHRLMVRGHRVVDNDLKNTDVRLTADAIVVDRLIVSSVIAVPMLAAALLYVLWKYRKRDKKSKKGVEGV